MDGDRISPVSCFRLVFSNEIFLVSKRFDLSNNIVRKKTSCNFGVAPVILHSTVIRTESAEQPFYYEPVRKFLESQESVVILSACARDSRGQACGTLKTGRGTNAKDVIRAT